MKKDLMKDILLKQIINKEAFDIFSRKLICSDQLKSQGYFDPIYHAINDNIPEYIENLIFETQNKIKGRGIQGDIYSKNRSVSVDSVLDVKSSEIYSRVKISNN